MPCRFDVNAISRPFGEKRGLESMALEFVRRRGLDPSSPTTKISGFPLTLPA